MHRTRFYLIFLLEVLLVSNLVYIRLFRQTKAKLNRDANDKSRGFQLIWPNMFTELINCCTSCRCTDITGVFIYENVLNYSVQETRRQTRKRIKAIMLSAKKYISVHVRTRSVLGGLLYLGFRLFNNIWVISGGWLNVKESSMLTFRALPHRNITPLSLIKPFLSLIHFRAYAQQKYPMRLPQVAVRTFLHGSIIFISRRPDYLLLFRHDLLPLTKKKGNHGFSRRNFLFLLTFFKEYKYGHFMWIVCRADNLLKMSITVFFEK